MATTTATPSISVPSDNMYVTGFVIPLADNQFLLKRDKIQYDPTSTNDKTHRVKDAENIWDIAYRRYGNSKLWYIIADANPIACFNPFEMDTGVELIIPDLKKINLQI